MNSSITFSDKNLDLSHIFPRFYKKIQEEQNEKIINNNKSILNKILLKKFNKIYPNISLYLDKINNNDQLKEIIVMASLAQSQDELLAEIKSKFPYNG